MPIYLEELVAHCSSGRACKFSTGHCWRQAWLRDPETWSSVTVLPQIKIKSACFKVVVEKIYSDIWSNQCRKVFCHMFPQPSAQRAGGVGGTGVSTAWRLLCWIRRASAVLGLIPKPPCVHPQPICWWQAGGCRPALGTVVLEQNNCDPRQQHQAGTDIPSLTWASLLFITMPGVVSFNSGFFWFVSQPNKL